MSVTQIWKHAGQAGIDTRPREPALGGICQAILSKQRHRGSGSSRNSSFLEMNMKIVTIQLDGDEDNLDADDLDDSDKAIGAGASRGGEKAQAFYGAGETRTHPL
jgi:hypothetical protein